MALLALVGLGALGVLAFAAVRGDGKGGSSPNFYTAADGALTYNAAARSRLRAWLASKSLVQSSAGQLPPPSQCVDIHDGSSFPSAPVADVWIGGALAQGYHVLVHTKLPLLAAGPPGVVREYAKPGRGWVVLTVPGDPSR
jgi:hypothetical protein